MNRPPKQSLFEIGRNEVFQETSRKEAELIPEEQFLAQINTMGSQLAAMKAEYD